ncbi:hypothetical protein H4Q26_003172 [Puccinia striiformis f. sp. tritici PST-130]|nr:hypothetical protein H4Q26_003172 [Puccinia striiformis f. sp. tritici PST-130]
MSDLFEISRLFNHELNEKTVLARFIIARSSLVAVKLVKVVIENHGLYISKYYQEYRDDQGKKPIDDIVIFRKEQYVDKLNEKVEHCSMDAGNGYTERNLKIGDTVLRHYEQRFRLPTVIPSKERSTATDSMNINATTSKNNVLKFGGRMTKANRRLSMAARKLGRDDVMTGSGPRPIPLFPLKITGIRLGFIPGFRYFFLFLL